MSKKFPSYLKLVAETPPSPPVVNEDLTPLAAVCEAFSQVTGLKLEYVGANAPSQPNLRWSAPVSPGVGVPPGLIRVLGFSEDALEGGSQIDASNLDAATSLASAIGGLWQELLITRQALCDREAELAASVPVVEHREEGRRLAARLEAVLRGGAEAVGGHAAALYLLNDDTSELKLRASWGLPRRRLAQQPRDLSNQLADLEALLGHAVVLDDPAMFGLWRVPEECQSCVCVPVSTPTMPLGTLWIFSQSSREFNDTDTNLIEVVAGRIAADLERETLLAEAKRLKSGTASVKNIAIETAKLPVEDEPESEDKYLHIRVKPTPPPAPPIVDGWQVAAAVVPKDRPTGAFVDWFQRPDGSLAILAGCVTGVGDQPALAASQLCAAARILGPDGLPVHQFIERADNLLWTNSQGDLSAGMLQANLFPGQKNLELAAGGPLHALHWVPGRVDLLAQPTRPLGMGNPPAIITQKVPLAEKELIVSYAITETFPERENWAHFVNSELTTVLGSMRKASAERLVELAHETLNRLLNPKRRRDRMVLVMRRS